ncbi:MAG: DUF779 domain-containing protein [Vulcanisaeta sp. AZ3]|nr:MAG: hypothetical protein TU36_01790 [Vulcanisaeta sp. AZ3]
MPNVSIEYGDDVKELLKVLKKRYGEIIIILGHGCCSPTEPEIYRASDFFVGNDYVEVARVYGVPFYIERDMLESYNGWALTLTVEPLNGAVDDSFSLDVLEGVRLRLRFKRFSIVMSRDLDVGGREILG